MSAELWIDGLDAALHYGLRIAESDGVRDLPQTRLDTITIPQVPGAALMTAPQIEVRPVALRGTLTGSSASDLRAKRDRLMAVLRRAAITVRLAEAPTRELVVIMTACTMAGAGATGLARSLPVTIQATALDPFWRDVTPTQVVVTGTPTPLPCGTAPSSPIIVLQLPGTVMALTLRDALGTVITELQLAGLRAQVPCTIDCARKTIRQNDTTVLHTLVRGDFPVLDAVAHGDFAAAAWPTLSVSQGTALVTYQRRWA